MCIQIHTHAEIWRLEESKHAITCPIDATSGAPNSNTFMMSKLQKNIKNEAKTITSNNAYANGKMDNLLKERPPTVLGGDHPITMSFAVSETPASKISISTHANSSFRDLCLTFSAIAPTAWAAATLVSQFLLWRYWEIYSSQDKIWANTGTFMITTAHKKQINQT